MKIVNVYIGTDSANTRKSKKRYGYMLECEMNGEPKTKDGFGELEGTYHETNLRAINEALERLNQSCEVHIHTEDSFIVHMIENNLDSWAGKGFTTSKGKPVENQEEWIRLWKSAQKQLIMAAAGKHSYSNWITDQIRSEDRWTQQNVAEESEKSERKEN